MMAPRSILLSIGMLPSHLKCLAGLMVWDTTTNRATACVNRRLRAMADATTALRPELRSGMFIVPRSTRTAISTTPNDLEGKSLRITPTGVGKALQYRKHSRTASPATGNRAHVVTLHSPPTTGRRRAVHRCFMSRDSDSRCRARDSTRERACRFTDPSVSRSAFRPRYSWST
jgi:hypothetical protein